MMGLTLPEVDNDLLHFVDVKDEVVSSTPAHELLHLLSVGPVIVVPDQAHHCCVISVFDDVVSGGPGNAVMGHQGEEQQSQDTVLRGASAQSGDRGGFLSHMHELRPVGQEVENPVAEGGAETQGCQFA